MAVSFYTTLNFALWPDHATPETIGVRTALGVGIAGWLASFLSTSLALYSEQAGVPLVDHLTYVNALALLLVVVVPVTLYAWPAVVPACSPQWVHGGHVDVRRCSTTWLRLPAVTRWSV